MYAPGINVNWVPGITLDEMEKSCILAAFRFYRGNKTQTSHALGISIRTLENKMERYEADKLAEQKRFDDDKRQHEEWNDRMRGEQITKQFAVGSSDQILTNKKRAGGFESGPIGIIERRTRSDGQSHGEVQTNGHETGGGLPVESAPSASSEQGVPMPQRPKVQEVLPKHTAPNSHKRNR